MSNFSEFRAVILAAGSGSQMSELVNERMPKCLLPIAGRPMIYYPIRMLQNHFNVIEIIVKSSEKSRIERALKNLETNERNVRLVLCEIDDDDCELGTLFALKRLCDRFGDYYDFDSLVIVSCDLICNSDVTAVLNAARKKKADFFSVWCESKIENLLKSTKLPPFIKTKAARDRDIIGINPANNQLLYMQNLLDMDRNGKLILPSKCLPTPQSVINVYPNKTDLHFYVLKKWLFLHIRDRCKELVTKQDETLVLPDYGISLKHDFLWNFVQMQFIRSKGVDNGRKESQTFRSIVHFEEDTFAFRVNNLGVYWYVNLNGDQFDFKNSQNTDYATVRNQKSTIGRNCSFANNTRITNSILMDNVRISGENCVLENCLICENVQIKSPSVLKNCLIGYDYCVNGSGAEVVLNDEILLLDTDDIFDGKDA